MIIVFNKANRPIGIAGQSVLPDKEIQVKDKDAYCAVFDENGEDTGEKVIIPGLKALEMRGFISIREVEEPKPAKPVGKKAEDKAEEKVEKKPSQRRSRSKKAAEEPSEE